MLEIRSRFSLRPHATYGVKVHDQLRLPFELRQKSRQRARLASGDEVAIALARGEVLRGGDWLVASDGRVIEVVAQAEKVLHVECDTPQALARAAYHLGNRHVAVEIGAGWLRIAADHVLEEMLAGLGARLAALEAPFEPEAGAYGAHHHHEEQSAHPGRIHEYSPPEAHRGPEPAAGTAPDKTTPGRGPTS